MILTTHDPHMKLTEIESAAIAGEILVRMSVPDRLYEDREFLVRVVRRLFDSVDVVDVWLKVRGESWLPEPDEQ